MLNKTISFIQKMGLLATTKLIVAAIADYLFDLNYGTNTSGCIELDELTIVSGDKQSGCKYQGTRVLALRSLFNKLKSDISPNSAFVDFGCGKGRVLLIASEFGFQEIKGVEFSEELCQIASENCAVYQKKKGIKKKLQVIMNDAAKYDIKPQEKFFFFYNPFDDCILQQVLENIVKSLQEKSRKIWLIYHNPTHSNVIEEQSIFRKLMDLKCWGYKFLVYSNK